MPKWALCAPSALLLMACAAPAWAGPVTQIANLGTLAAPATLVYGNAFNDLNPQAPGVQIAPAGVPITLNPGDSFHEQYGFTVGPVVASFITLSIDLGNVFNVDGLSVRLYDATGLASPVLGAQSLLSGQAPVARSAATPSGGPGEQQTINAVNLVAGRYVLEVQGFVTGVSGGGYSGVVNLSPLPEPAGWWLVTAALALAAAASRAAKVRTDHARQQQHTYRRHR